MFGAHHIICAAVRLKQHETLGDVELRTLAVPVRGVYNATWLLGVEMRMPPSRKEDSKAGAQTNIRIFQHEKMSNRRGKSSYVLPFVCSSQTPHKQLKAVCHLFPI